MPPEVLNLAPTAGFAGVTPGALRQWLSRHGWPHPTRDRHGRWTFTERQAIEIRDVAQRLAAGACLRDLIEDGHLRQAPHPRHRPPFHLDLVNLPDPPGREAQQVRRTLVLGLLHQHPGRVRQAIAQCACLHPRDRGLAVLLVLDAARRQNPAYAAWIDQAVED